MTKIWASLKTFIGSLDFADARKDVADDLKKASVAMWSLWLLSIVSRLPVAFSVLPKVLGIDATVIQTSAWVSWLLFGVATLIYVAQVALRIKLRKVASASQQSV